MTTKVKFPLTIYNGLIAYQLGIPDGFASFHELSFDSFISQYGFINCRSVGDMTLMTTVLDSVCPSSTIKMITTLHPAGYAVDVVINDESQKLEFCAVRLHMNGLYCNADYSSHEYFMRGSLAVTKCLTKSAKIFRDNFAIPHDPIHIQPLPEFLALVKERMLDLYPDQDTPLNKIRQHIPLPVK